MQIDESRTDADGNTFRFSPIACPTCETNDTRFLGLRGGAYQRYGRGVESRIVQCNRCKLLYANPFPFPADPQKLYGDPSKYFAHQDTTAKLEGARTIIRRASSISKTPPRSYLDIGSGRGEFLRAAQLEGLPTVVGLELSQAAVAHASEQYGVTVRPETVEQYARSATESFDLVTLNAVLEHVYDPNATIAAVKALTRPGSLLYVDVPNEPHLLTHIVGLANRLRRRPGVINLSPTFPPYHVFGFNPGSLRTLLAKHDFRIVDLAIHASTKFASDGTLKDRVRCAVATGAMAIANATRTASNLFVWAERM